MAGEGERLTDGVRTILDFQKQDINFEADALLGNLNYLKGGSTSRVRSVQRRLTKSVEVSDAVTRDYIKNNIPTVYQDAMVAAAGGATELTALDKGWIAETQKTARITSNSATRAAKRDIRALRQVRDADPRQVQGMVNDGIVRSQRFDSGRRMDYNAYQQMVVRTHAQRSFNAGTLSGIRKTGVKVVRISDGPDCGLTKHDDPFKVNGLVLRIEEAEDHLISHPNCTRTFSPAPDEDRPPPLGTRRDALVRKARELRRQGIVEINWANIALDMLADEQMREMVFGAVIRGSQEMRNYQLRIGQYIERLRNGGATTVPKEEDVIARLLEMLDDLIENAGQGAPEWVYEILDARSTQELKAVGEGFTRYSELTMRSRMTHAELNLINTLENHYGHFFQARLSAAHPDLRDSLLDVYRGVRQHYNEPRWRHVSAPGLGGSAGRGVRFRWNSRPVRVQTTLVNSFRHMTRDELRGAMALAGKVGTGMKRQDMIQALGYMPGMLSHMTINPNGLFRLGLRLSPTGWIQPEIRLVPTTIPLRYTARLNRGRMVDGVRIRSVTQEAHMITGRYASVGTGIPGNGRIALDNVGISTRTYLGRIDNYEDLKRLLANLNVSDVNLKSQSTANLKSIARFLKVDPSGPDWDNRDELIRAISNKGYGLTGWELLQRNTEVINLFAEMKLMGYNSFQISRVFRITPEQAREFLKMVDAIYGSAWREGGMALLMDQIARRTVQRIDRGLSAVQLRAKGTTDSAVDKWNDSAAISNQLAEWFQQQTINELQTSFLGRAYREYTQLADFAASFGRGPSGRWLAGMEGKTSAEVRQALVGEAQAIAGRVGIRLNASSMLVKAILTDVRLHGPEFTAETALALQETIKSHMDEMINQLIVHRREVEVLLPALTTGMRLRIEQYIDSLNEAVDTLKERIRILQENTMTAVSALPGKARGLTILPANLSELPDQQVQGPILRIVRPEQEGRIRHESEPS